MKKVTVKLDEETAARARVKAAEQKMSLSRYIGELLRRAREIELRYKTRWRCATTAACCRT